MCPNKDEERCLVVYQLTNIDFYPTAEDCSNCSKQNKPQALNDYTKAVSSELLVEAGKPPLYYGQGPGTRLKNLIGWFIETPPGCDCENRSQIMDAWGVKGCRNNLNTIINWLDEAALLKGINITRLGIKALVESVLYVSILLDRQKEIGLEKNPEVRINARELIT
jgi:hypothetical protein